MAEVRHRTQVHYTVQLDLTESEARALEGLTGFSPSEVVSALYRELGRHYLEPHEAGFRSLLNAAQKQISPELTRIDEARKALKGG